MSIYFAHESGDCLQSRQFSLWVGRALQASIWWLGCVHLNDFLMHMSDVGAGKTQTDAAGRVGALRASFSLHVVSARGSLRNGTSYRAADSSQSQVPRENLGEMTCLFLTSLRNHRTSLSRHSVPRGPPRFKVRRLTPPPDEKSAEGFMDMLENHQPAVSRATSGGGWWKAPWRQQCLPA